MFLTGNFELGVGRGVEGTRKNHPIPSYKAKSHFQIGTKNLSKSGHPTLSRKKLEHFKVSFFIPEKKMKSIPVMS